MSRVSNLEDGDVFGDGDLALDDDAGNAARDGVRDEVMAVTDVCLQGEEEFARPGEARVIRDRAKGLDCARTLREKAGSEGSTEVI